MSGVKPYINTHCTHKKPEIQKKKTPYACRMWVYVETVAVVHTTAAHCLAQMEIGACLMFRDPRGGDKNISQGLLPLVNL